MRIIRSRARALSLFTVLALVAGCEQVDQAHPLDVMAGQPVSRSIGPEGGVVSIPPGFSIEFPAGAFPQSVFVPVTPRVASSPFPDDAGAVVPGTAFDIGPAGVALNLPALVFIRVPEALLDLDMSEDLRLVLALEHTDGSVSLWPGSYNATNGLLSAEIDQIGPVAAVVAADSIEIEVGPPLVLSGGAFSFLPFPGGPAPTSR